MADNQVGVPTRRRGRAGPLGASPDIRMRQLASGAWEIGGSMSDKQLREEAIRLKAYELWEDAGRPHGAGLEFWLAAERWYDADADAETADEDSFPASDPPANTGITGPE